MSRKLFEFAFPDIGEGLTEGKVLELRAQPGQAVKQGQTLAVVETDKVVADIPSPRDGVLVSFGVREGEIVKVGQVLATLELPEEAAQGETPSIAASLVGSLETAATAELPPSTEGRPSPASAAPAHGLAASPVARQLAAASGLDLAAVQGTGPGGRVLRRDVQAAAEGARGPGAAGREGGGIPGQRVPLSTLRRSLAANLERSNAIPSAVIFELTPVDELVELRKRLNQGREDRLGLLPFFVRIAALALGEHPLLNAAYDPKRQEVELFEEVNLGIAVDTEDGLTAPVIRRADTLSLPGLQAEVERLAAAARSRGLRLEDLRGGTFTITNFGSFAGLYGRPLILPPQVGILGIGRLHDQPVLRSGGWGAVPHLPLSLVFDHRVLDGAYAARFLRRFMDLAAGPHQLLLY